MTATSSPPPFTGGQRLSFRSTRGTSLKTALEPFDLECITPDEFLVQQYHADPQLLVERVHGRRLRAA